MSYCGHCGASNVEGVKFCSACGKEMTGIISCQRQGKQLVVKRGAVFPSSCVKCGRPVQGVPLEKNFIWYNPWLNLLIFLGCIGWIILTIAYYSTRKQFKLAVPLCDEHRQKRRNKILIGSLCLALCPVIIIVAVGVSNPDIALLCTLLLIALIIVGVAMLALSPVLRTVRIDDQQAVFKGAGEAFLKQIETGGC